MAQQPRDPNPPEAAPTGATPGGSQPSSPAPGFPPQLVVLQQAVPATVPTRERLSGRAPPPPGVGVGPVTVAFPPCADELLSLATLKTSPPDDVNRFFGEYFKFLPHSVLALGSQNLANYLDDGLLKCVSPGPVIEVAAGPTASHQSAWPSDGCFCSPCVTLDGNRPPPSAGQPGPANLRRLFAGDLLWLFYFERMGLFQILGAILDAYAYSGRLPISNGSLDPDLRDDLVAVVLEAMVRQTKTGLSSTVRDRTGAYRTVLGWTSEPGRKLAMDTVVGTGFNSLFHKLIFHALEFYKDKRLAFAIRGAAADQPPPSAATLITLRDTIEVLKRRFEPFSYGRTYTNTLSGIVWAIASMSVVRELRSTLGIPAAFNTPDEYLPAAYELLVLKRPVTQGEINRYLVHRECAQNGRDLLLDLEVLNHQDAEFGGELDRWLQQIESKVEGYRTAYRTLTGVDLGLSATPAIEQQA